MDINHLLNGMILQVATWWSGYNVCVSQSVSKIHDQQIVVSKTKQLGQFKYQEVQEFI